MDHFIQQLLCPTNRLAVLVAKAVHLRMVEHPVQVGGEKVTATETAKQLAVQRGINALEHLLDTLVPLERLGTRDERLNVREMAQADTLRTLQRSFGERLECPVPGLDKLHIMFRAERTSASKQACKWTERSYTFSAFLGPILPSQQVLVDRIILQD